ncbi:hypothetical protein A4S06_09900 [Erysipelotrichaceae bacterium MTC7]|nr:hypothetical protein A4S06_09900 [Erysipelotrichaceae bacterium MTC7]
MAFFKKKAKFIMPCEGEIIDLASVNDAVFSSGTMGPGFAITPIKGILYAPANASIDAIFPTKHAIGMTLQDGVEVLLHIGIDTVNLKGEGFSSYVHNGSKVKQGDKLVEFDLPFLLSKDIDPTIMVLFTNKKQVEVQNNSYNEKSEININIQ